MLGNDTSTLPKCAAAGARRSEDGPATSLMSVKATCCKCRCSAVCLAVKLLAAIRTKQVGNILIKTDPAVGCVHFGLGG